MKKNLELNKGFSLIELMVVISIMAVILTVSLANLAGQRVPRDSKIAQSELVTNLRKLQSYMISGRNLPGSTQAPAYYVMKLDLSNPNQYVNQIIYKDTNGVYHLRDLETIKIPPTIRLSGLAVNGTGITNGCLLVGFRAPFAKVIFNDGCVFNSFDTATPYCAYKKITDYVTNTSCSDSPDMCTAKTDVSAVITMTDINSDTVTKTVTVNAITGGIDF